MLRTTKIFENHMIIVCSLQNCYYLTIDLNTLLAFDSKISLFFLLVQKCTPSTVRQHSSWNHFYQQNIRCKKINRLEQDFSTTRSGVNFINVLWAAFTRAGVNVINVKSTNFLYECRFGSFYYVHLTRKKLPKPTFIQKFFAFNVDEIDGRSQKCKNPVSPSVFLWFLWSSRLKASGKMLVKSAHGNGLWRISNGSQTWYKMNFI